MITCLELTGIAKFYITTYANAQINVKFDSSHINKNGDRLYENVGPRKYIFRCRTPKMWWRQCEREKYQNK
jgi:hypothetical protein